MIRVKVAAYQAPLLASGSGDTAVDLIRDRVLACESDGVEILCCPEGVLGGLADDARRPRDIAVAVEGGALDAVLAPLASDTVTTIVGFTEIDRRGRLLSSAAVWHKGSVAGIYRKRHPAINHSVYDAGDTLPVFTIGGLTFGILICRDSNDPIAARDLAARGAAALFIPTNNGLPHDRAHAEVAAEARRVDCARAIESGVAVVRADVSGRTADLMCCGSSAIVDSRGTVLRSAPQLSVGLVVADIEVTARAPRGEAVRETGHEPRAV
jgi:predicted amidohydrolase